jgi:HEAT repeats
MSAPTHRHRGTALRTGISILLLTLTTAPASARERALYLQLEGASEDALPGVLERMAASKPEGDARVASAQAVAKLLERGHTDVVTDRALEALGVFGAPEPPRSAGDRQSPGTVARASVPEPPRSAGDRQSPGTVARASVPAAGAVLAQYARHRRVAARMRAITALGRVAGSDKSLRAVVANGLRDTAPEVRAAAARSLEALKATEATPVLLKAVGRGVPEAAVTLGAIGEPGSLEAYNAYLRKQPLDVMLSGYERWLLRPDVSEKAKLDILAKLEDVSGPLVLRFMSAVPRQAQLAAAVKEAASASTLRIAKAEAQRQAKPAAPAATPTPKPTGGAK